MTHSFESLHIMMQRKISGYDWDFFKNSKSINW